MRSARVFLLLLLVILAGSVLCAACYLQGSRTEVSYTLKRSLGDPACADGMEAELHDQLRDHLFWDSTLRFEGGVPDVSTEFRFEPDPKYYSAPRNYYGLALFDGITELENSELITQTIEEIKASLEPGSSASRSVPLTDFFSYYPLEFDVDLEQNFFANEIPQERGMTDNINGPRALLRRQLQEFFRIPVREDDRLILDVTRDFDDASGSVSSSSGWYADPDSDSFSMGFSTAGVAAKDACYFTFSNRTSKGNLVDTSLIPGGYGVYRIPYGCVEAENYKGFQKFRGWDFDGSQLALFFPVAPEAETVFLQLDPEEESLLLHTVEDGVYWISQIRLSDGALMQRIEIAPFDRESGWAEARMQEDFLMLHLADDRFCVLRKESGLYAVKLCHVFSEAEKDPSFLPWHSTRKQRSFAFDGERFAVIERLEADFPFDGSTFRLGDTDFCLAVYTADGLGWYGEFVSSLGLANAGAQYADRIAPIDAGAAAVRLP